MVVIMFECAILSFKVVYARFVYSLYLLRKKNTDKFNQRHVNGKHQKYAKNMHTIMKKKYGELRVDYGSIKHQKKSSIKS